MRFLFFSLVPSLCIFFLHCCWHYILAHCYLLFNNVSWLFPTFFLLFILFLPDASLLFNVVNQWHLIATHCYCSLAIHCYFYLLFLWHLIAFHCYCFPMLHCSLAKPRCCSFLFLHKVSLLLDVIVP